MWGADSAETPWEFGGLSQEDDQFGLSQESFGLSQSQSQSQYDADIGLSQYNLSQQSQSGSKRRSAAASTPTCLECQSAEIVTTNDGDMVCADCGTAFEGNVNEVTEVDAGLVTGGTRRRRVKILKDKIPQRLDVRGWPMVLASTRECLEAFQLALGLNVKAFCAAAELSGEAAAEVKRVASEVWFPYLERLTLPPACGHSGIRVRDEFRTRQDMGNVKSRPSHGGGGGGAGEGLGAINVNERTLRAFGGDTKPWGTVIKKARKVPGYTVPPLSMEMIPAILCVCARWMRSPILAVDVARWMRDGSLPFKGCLMRLPESVRMGLGTARYFFMPVTVPPPQHLSNLADRLAAMLGLELPPLNVPAVARRLVDGMGMPAPVLSAVETLGCFSVGNPCAPNPATARRSVAFGNVRGERLVRGKKTAMTSSPVASGGGGSGSKGRKRGGDSKSGGKREDGRRRSDSNGSGSKGSGSGTCDEADDADRARRKLRRFLSDASPLHVMALVVAAAKGCPGWDSWRYARPALLPPAIPGVPAKEAGTRESTGVVKGGDGASAHPRSSKGSIGVGHGTGTGTTTFRREDSRAPFLFPSHPAELRLLLRGRLPDYLRRVEESSGGAEFSRGWIDSASVVSPALEAVADEIEKRRRQQQHRLRDEPALATRVSRASTSSLCSGNRRGHQSFDADRVLMGAVRAAHVVAGACSVTEVVEREKEKEEDTKRSLPPVPASSNSVEIRPEDMVTADQLNQPKEEIGSSSSSSADEPSRVPRGLAGREAEGKNSDGEGKAKGAVVVYDPDELTSRFHPHYELLVEACACYMEVPPYMLQELVEKLDWILVDHAQREYRQTQDPSKNYPTQFELKARELLREVGRVEPETVERRGVFSKREGPTSIHRRFISQRPAVHRSFTEASDTDRDGNEDPKDRFWAAVRKVEQDYPVGFDSETMLPQCRPPAPAIAILGGDTLRPPPFQSSSLSRAVAAASTADRPAAAAASAASVTSSASAEHEPEATKGVEGGGGAEEGGKGVPSTTTKPKDEEVRWLLHSVGAGSDPFVDDDYTEGVGRRKMIGDGVDAVGGYRVRTRGRTGTVEKGEARSSGSLRGKERRLARGSEFESNEALTQGGDGVEEEVGGEEGDGGGAGVVDARDDLSSVGRQEEE